MNPRWSDPQTVGVLREIKTDERRVALTPEGARRLVADGRAVVIETGAGLGSGHEADEYRDAGASIVSGPGAVTDAATLLVHVKEPQPSEFALLRPDHTLFTYLHLAAAPELVSALRAARCRAIAYESVEVDGHFPLLAPMSAIAGRLATQNAASFLEARHGGRGVLLGGVPGAEPSTVIVVGAGVVGSHAAEVAVGMGAEVVIVDLDLRRAEAVAQRLGARAVQSQAGVLEDLAPTAEVMIGAVLAPGHRAPTVITRKVLDLMPEGSVVIDIAIDQGGCVEGVVATSHSDPVRSMGRVRVAATPNMPAAVPRTSTAALCAATLPYIRALAGGWDRATSQHPELAGAVNIQDGRIVLPALLQEYGEP
ncbi:MAG: alanine dehydrogenase [Ilumatobacteraceae bacterium]